MKQTAMINRGVQGACPGPASDLLRRMCPILPWLSGDSSGLETQSSQRLPQQSLISITCHTYSASLCWMGLHSAWLPSGMRQAPPAVPSWQEAGKKETPAFTVWDPQPQGALKQSTWPVSAHIFIFEVGTEHHTSLDLTVVTIWQHCNINH